MPIFDVHYNTHSNKLVIIHIEALFFLYIIDLLFYYNKEIKGFYMNDNHY